MRSGGPNSTSPATTWSSGKRSDSVPAAGSCPGTTATSGPRRVPLIIRPSSPTRKNARSPANPSKSSFAVSTWCRRRPFTGVIAIQAIVGRASVPDHEVYADRQQRDADHARDGDRLLVDVQDAELVDDHRERELAGDCGGRHPAGAERPDGHEHRAHVRDPEQASREV